MIALVSLFFLSNAEAASLDNLEVGGAWGTPLSTDATALWWSPAGLAAERGGRVLLEVDPIFANITYERQDPLRSGVDTIRMTGVLPYVGFATDLRIPGFGMGAAIGVPIARGGKTAIEDSVGRYALREGSQNAVYGMFGAGYAIPKTPVSVGAMVALVRSSFSSRVDTELASKYDADIRALGQTSGYTDAIIEDPNYSATLNFARASDLASVQSLSVRVDLDPKLKASATWISRASVKHRGDVDIAFRCPPQTDVLGRFGAESYGLCDTTLKANGSVAYRLPSRIHAGVQYEPLKNLHLTGMAGMVFWSQYKDLDITISGVETLNDLANPATAEKVNQTRKWARDSRNSPWLAIDAKADLQDDQVTVGGRLTFDAASVPERALSTNNYDASNLILTGLAAVRPSPNLQIGLQFSHQFLFQRTVDESGFLATLDPAQAPEDRWFYPQANGVYTGSINRVGLSVRGKFGATEP